MADRNDAAPITGDTALVRDARPDERGAVRALTCVRTPSMPG